MLGPWLWATAASSKLWQFMLADWITWGLVAAATQSVEVGQAAALVVDIHTRNHVQSK